MSHNLHLPGCPYPLYQTPTEFTWRMVRARPALPREEVLEAYYREIVEPRLAPLPLSGKDARNPFLLRQREQQEAEQRYDHYTRILEWLRANPQVGWEET